MLILEACGNNELNHKIIIQMFILTLWSDILIRAPIESNKSVLGSPTIYNSRNFRTRLCIISSARSIAERFRRQVDIHFQIV